MEVARAARTHKESNALDRILGGVESVARAEDRAAGESRSGNFVFTGVDDDPGTVETLSKLGFSDPRSCKLILEGGCNDYSISASMITVSTLPVYYPSILSG